MVQCFFLFYTIERKFTWGGTEEPSVAIYPVVISELTHPFPLTLGFPRLSSLRQCRLYVDKQPASLQINTFCTKSGAASPAQLQRNPGHHTRYRRHHSNPANFTGARMSETDSPGRKTPIQSNLTMLQIVAHGCKMLQETKDAEQRCQKRILQVGKPLYLQSNLTMLQIVAKCCKHVARHPECCRNRQKQRKWRANKSAT